MSEAIGNISVERKGNKLIITLDASKVVGRTKKDTGNVIAATGGYVPVEHDGKVLGMLSLHMWERDPKEATTKKRRAFSL